MALPHIKKINFQTFDHTDILVVLGAGPSYNDNCNKILPYIKNRKSVIIGCNHNFSIPADYSIYIDWAMYEQCINECKAPNIIISSGVYGKQKQHIKTNTSKNYFIVSNNETIGVHFPDAHATKINHKTIDVNKLGHINHRLGNSGMASALISCFFYPKEVLLVGFDGPNPGLRKMDKFYGIAKKITHRNRQSMPDKKKYFSNRLIPFLQNKGILVSCFATDKFWDIDRKNIKVLP